MNNLFPLLFAFVMVRNSKWAVTENFAFCFDLHISNKTSKEFVVLKILAYPLICSLQT